MPQKLPQKLPKKLPKKLYDSAIYQTFKQNLDGCLPQSCLNIAGILPVLVRVALIPCCSLIDARMAESLSRYFASIACFDY